MRRPRASFGFGFAPDDRQRAARPRSPAFGERCWSRRDCCIAVEEPAAGSARAREPYDRFRGRLMMPIQRSARAGDRVRRPHPRGDANRAPKYLNSPDTPLFDKGRTLFNLDRAAPLARKSGRRDRGRGLYGRDRARPQRGSARRRAARHRADRAAARTAVAAQVETPMLCFDGDAAGQSAAMRAVTRALPLLRPAHSCASCAARRAGPRRSRPRATGRPAMTRLLAGAQSAGRALWQSRARRAAARHARGARPA